MADNLRVLVAGTGNMGASHARSYHKINGFEVCGLVARSKTRSQPLAEELDNPPIYHDFYEALKEAKPDVVSVNTYPDTHAEYAIASLESGAHVFLEKPVAVTLKDAEAVIAAAEKNNKKLVIGYILRVHPSWTQFIDLTHSLGKPLVMRMNLNQQSSGKTWATHKSLMESMSPIVDCGVHYVDVMCLMTKSQPVKVSGIGARLSDEVDAKMYNYGQLQVTFADGSVGWYEAGWGPMISENAFFIKDVMGPKGSVSMVNKVATKSDDIDSHSTTNQLKVHWAETDQKGDYVKPDQLLDTSSEPDHQELCNKEQELLLKAIREDMDMKEHHRDAINSLKIVLAADESFKTGKTIDLE